jgi:hypothetical protein
MTAQGKRVDRDTAWCGSLFTDLAPRGPDGLFTPGQLDELIGAVKVVRAHAEAA